MRLGVALGVEAATTTSSFNWPYLPLSSGENLDLSVVPNAQAAYSLKLFALEASAMSLQGVQGERLTLSLQNDDTHIALWLNYGGWAGADCPPYFNAGFEPTNVAYDSLAHAARNGRAAVLASGSTHRWRLVVEAG